MLSHNNLINLQFDRLLSRRTAWLWNEVWKHHVMALFLNPASGRSFDHWTHAVATSAYLNLWEKAACLALRRRTKTESNQFLSVLTQAACGWVFVSLSSCTKGFLHLCKKNKKNMENQLKAIRLFDSQIPKRCTSILIFKHMANTIALKKVQI